MNDNKKFWDRCSFAYTRLQEKSNQKSYDLIVEKCQSYVDNKEVLELACGTGQFSFGLAKHAKKYLATDYSSKMVEQAIKRNNSEIIFETADATDLKYQDESFDVVIIANALHIMPCPDLALAEIKRVLKKDGILITPNFIYDCKYNHFRIWLLERLGFKTFNKWTSIEFVDFVEEQGFKLIKKEVVLATPLAELLAIYEKRPL